MAVWDTLYLSNVHHKQHSSFRITHKHLWDISSELDNSSNRYSATGRTGIRTPKIFEIQRIVLAEVFATTTRTLFPKFFIFVEILLNEHVGLNCIVDGRPPRSSEPHILFAGRKTWVRFASRPRAFAQVCLSKKTLPLFGELWLIRTLLMLPLT